MSEAGNERPETQTDVSGRPTKPPGNTGRGSEHKPRDPGRTVYLLDSMLVKDLAVVIGVKPFRIVADLMQMKLLRSPDDSLDFETASAIARKHGYRAERPPPGGLVL
jgi:translation initiation factor IF-2